MTIMKGAEPFFLPGNEKGVILIHGFTGSPAEMRPLGEYLNQQGFTVTVPRLAGHGSCIKELQATGCAHWYGSAEDGYHLLKPRCKTISVIGLSMGGLLAFKLAKEYAVDKVVALSVPIFLQDKRLPLLPLYSLLRTTIPKRRRQYAAGAQYNVSYDHTPLKGVAEVLRIINNTKLILPQIIVPTLIVQSKAEHTVKPESAEYILANLGSLKKQILWLKESGHVITLDKEREFVFKMINEFLGGE